MFGTCAATLEFRISTNSIIMDKIAANNHFVFMRKEIKKAKAMVGGNLIRKINKLKQEKEKLTDESEKKLDDKIARILDETKLLKTIDPYTIAKHATLTPDPKFWNKVICDSKATAEQILEARIITKNNVQKCVMKFRSDYQECDEWLAEYIEYREKKRDLTQVTKPLKKKNKEFKDKSKSKFDSNDRDKSSLRQPKSDYANSNHAKQPSKKPRTIQVEGGQKDESLHPSWESKRKEKELLKAALSGNTRQPRKIVF